MGGALVLGRKIGESVMIGDDIEVTVVEIRSGQVKLRIVARREVPVHRLEVWRRVVLERRRASQARGGELPDHRPPSERRSGEAA